MSDLRLSKLDKRATEDLLKVGDMVIFHLQGSQGDFGVDDEEWKKIQQHDGKYAIVIAIDAQYETGAEPQYVTIAFEDGYDIEAADAKTLELRGKKLVSLNKKATGEPDQDYDHEFFDAIVSQLAAAGFDGVKHKEFDKYQGVYLLVPGVDRFWMKDVFYAGTGEGEHRTAFVIFSPEDSQATEIEVLEHDYDKSVDASELVEYCKANSKKTASLKISADEWDSFYDWYTKKNNINLNQAYDQIGSMSTDEVKKHFEDYHHSTKSAPEPKTPVKLASETTYVCEKCGKEFKNIGKKTEPAEYPGGKAWTFDVSPCCSDDYHPKEQELATNASETDMEYAESAAKERLNPHPGYYIKFNLNRVKQYNRAVLAPEEDHGVIDDIVSNGYTVKVPGGEKIFVNAIDVLDIAASLKKKAVDINEIKVGDIIEFDGGRDQIPDEIWDKIFEYDEEDADYKEVTFVCKVVNVALDDEAVDVTIIEPSEVKGKELQVPDFAINNVSSPRTRRRADKEVHCHKCNKVLTHERDLHEKCPKDPNPNGNHSISIMDMKYIKQSSLAKEATPITRAADTDEQERMLSQIEEWAQALGVKVHLGTKVGRRPQTVILDIGYQDNAISVDSDGQTEVYGKRVADQEGFSRAVSAHGTEKESALDKCPCGSGEFPNMESDAKGINLGYMCSKCREARLGSVRHDVLKNPNYEADEPVEASLKVKAESVVLDTVDYKNFKFQKWLKDHNISSKVVNKSGPGGGWPEIEYVGSRKDLEEMIKKHFDDPDLNEFIEASLKTESKWSIRKVGPEAFQVFKDKEYQNEFLFKEDAQQYIDEKEKSRKEDLGLNSSLKTKADPNPSPETVQPSTLADEALEMLDTLIDIQKVKASLSKKAGAWALPFSEGQASKIAEYLDKLSQGELPDRKEIYTVLGVDELWDTLDKLDDTLAGKYAQVIRTFIKKMLADYKQRPDSYSKPFEPAALEILETISHISSTSSLNKKSEEPKKPETKEKPVEYKELKIRPKDVSEDEVRSAELPTEAILGAYKKLKTHQNNLAEIKRMIDGVKAKFNEEVTKIETEGKKVEDEAGIRQSVDDLAALISSAQSRVMSFGSKLVAFVEEEKEVPFKITDKEKLERILDKFPDVEKYLAKLEASMKHLDTKEKVKKLIEWELRDNAAKPKPAAALTLSKLDKIAGFIDTLKSIYDAASDFFSSITGLTEELDAILPAQEATASLAKKADSCPNCKLSSTLVQNNAKSSIECENCGWSKPMTKAAGARMTKAFAGRFQIDVKFDSPEEAKEAYEKLLEVEAEFHFGAEHEADYVSIILFAGSAEQANTKVEGLLQKTNVEAKTIASLKLKSEWIHCEDCNKQDSDFNMNYCRPCGKYVCGKDYDTKHKHAHGKRAASLKRNAASPYQTVLEDAAMMVDAMSDFPKDQGLEQDYYEKLLGIVPPEYLVVNSESDGIERDMFEEMGKHYGLAYEHGGKLVLATNQSELELFEKKDDVLGATIYSLEAMTFAYMVPKELIKYFENELKKKEDAPLAEEPYNKEELGIGAKLEAKAEDLPAEVQRAEEYKSPNRMIVLPTGTRIKAATPETNEFWSDHKEGGFTLVEISGDTFLGKPNRKILIGGWGSDYPVGEKVVLEHDQYPGRVIGRGQVLGSISGADWDADKAKAVALMGPNAVSYYVFK